MAINKIIRSICLFSSTPNNGNLSKLDNIHKVLESHDFLLQTKRLCVGTKDFDSLKDYDDGIIYLSIGTLSYNEAFKQLGKFYPTKNIAFNIDLTHENIENKHIDILFKIIKNDPSKTFSFTYTFNNAHSSPYFPSAMYNTDGFSIGLQPTDLSDGCKSLDEWLEKMKIVWDELNSIFKDDSSFLGIDSSIAPLFNGKSSLINFIKRLGMSFPDSVTTNTYMQITNFIKKHNPKPAGLCGLMLPCLEDFELADEYEKGEFSIERNIFLSLHSGLGIDTYPIGIDESQQRVIEILKLIQGLSNKYNKPLSARFVSDGKAKIGERTNFKNQYLKDVIVRQI